MFSCSLFQNMNVCLTVCSAFLCLYAHTFAVRLFYMCLYANASTAVNIFFHVLMYAYKCVHGCSYFFNSMCVAVILSCVGVTALI